jgi:hypothetical protein
VTRVYLALLTAALGSCATIDPKAGLDANPNTPIIVPHCRIGDYAARCESRLILCDDTGACACLRLSEELAR